MRLGSSERFWITGVLFVFVLLVRCGPENPERTTPDGDGDGIAIGPRDDGGIPDASTPDASMPAPPEPRFQTTFSLALRESERVPDVTTYRQVLPSVLAGDAVRVSFRAGDGGMSLLRATVSTAAAPTPVELPLPEEAKELAPDARITSESAPLLVTPGDPVIITFEVSGTIATSGLQTLPEGAQRGGSHATVEGPLEGAARTRPAGVVALEVRALPSPILVALGDSITQGYVSGTDDTRKAWPQLAATELEMPFLNAGVSSQGVRLAAENLDEEVLSLTGITDCVMLLGTNDLHAFSAEALIAELSALFERMRPHCRVWGATLLPKERTSAGNLSEVNAVRAAVNAWLRDEAPVEGVIDFEAALRGGSPDTFAEGLAEDGIHPSVEGQVRMGEAAAAFFRAQPALTPPE